jgi:hypothetical protein
LSLRGKAERKDCEEKKSSSKQRRFHFFPPLPHAREFEVVLRIRKRSCRLRTSPVSWLGGVASSQPSRTVARFCHREAVNERVDAVVCELLFSPYSRAAATACATAERLPVFPSTKSTVIVGGVNAR